MEHKTIDRFRGCLYGQAIGDALGLGTEFMTDEDIAWKYPHGLQHYKQIYQDRHRKRWEIGDWTDDTDMMLCIADEVIEDKGVNFYNIARHFKDWANGTPMGIGENTYKVLMIGDYVEHPFDVSHKVWEMSKYQSAANGGLMRTSVVGLFPTEVRTCAEKYLSAHPLRSKMCRLMRNSVRTYTRIGLWYATTDIISNKKFGTVI